MVEGGGFGTDQTYGARIVDPGLWMAATGRQFRRIFRLWKKSGVAKLEPYPGEC